MVTRCKQSEADMWNPSSSCRGSSSLVSAVPALDISTPSPYNCLLPWSAARTLAHHLPWHLNRSKRSPQQPGGPRCPGRRSTRSPHPDARVHRGELGRTRRGVVGKTLRERLGPGAEGDSSSRQLLCAETPERAVQLMHNDGHSAHGCNEYLLSHDIGYIVVKRECPKRRTMHVERSMYSSELEEIMRNMMSRPSPSYTLM
ncbi:hypothetical protein L226DRAFT_166384 [Lentinus tigrinus ALCF2SS1-7]|uniref:uncharacterized protein n=1 Tax=Lentinus tigrinus ALCF2SS1-7 TaxID=1328758 RepID=UPI0011663F02|nr:hypothetical protein L226DRAFT_166384 [Lentinus tigrinus ALCF2SS1-7]